ncbi:MAG: NADH-quinone oxidoreductase subunit NuoK [Chloroflexi bacterium]|nr:NADH-quinone oxidoreductase subunit NuoK [Chloroflexota bacterium]
MSVGLNHYLILSAILFSIGLYGALGRRNAIVVLMSIELMLNAANIALIAFSRYVASAQLAGQAFALFVIIVAAAEAVVALAIIMTVYRSRKTVEVDRINLLKW